MDILSSYFCLDAKVTKNQGDDVSEAPAKNPWNESKAETSRPGSYLQRLTLI